MNWLAVAKSGYAAFCREKNQDAKSWEQLSDDERDAWIAATKEVGLLTLKAVLA